MVATILGNIELDYPDYLRDESRRIGTAQSISFPVSEAQIVETVAEMFANDVPVTIQGARTGIAGGAVPDGGHILNLSRMTEITRMRRSDSEPDSFIITAQPGVLLSQLNAAIAAASFDTTNWSTESMDALQAFRTTGPWFFPPDPTETSAAIGGMTACNASGARTFAYGPTRDYVERIRVVLADGATLELTRGREKADGRTFSLHTESGSILAGRLPSYAMPTVKNAAGYFAADDMDMLDLFVGAEGTLGVLSEIDIRLVRAPHEVWGVVSFLPSSTATLAFVTRTRQAGAKPAAIEYFDSRSLDLLRAAKLENPAFSEIPDLPQSCHTAVYVEYHGSDEDAVSEAVMAMSEIMVECGGNEDAAWLASSARELEKLKAFRHAVPEAVNLVIDNRRKENSELTKLGTDMAVPDNALERITEIYSADLQEHKLDYVMFGHIGDNHIHVNVLPRNMSEYAVGKELYLTWAREVIRLGGSVSAEHGIGKLKSVFLREMFGEQGIAEMQAVRRVFDPKSILNRGNLF
jgi:D-lactate dehydrogenase (cytochrome)